MTPEELSEIEARFERYQNHILGKGQLVDSPFRAQKRFCDTSEAAIPKLIAEVHKLRAYIDQFGELQVYEDWCNRIDRT